MDCRDGGKKPGRSILDVGVETALLDSGLDEKRFLDRGGILAIAVGERLGALTTMSGLVITT